MLKKLIELLPVSRRQYMKTLAEISMLIQGLIEAESNHCQIETNLIQQFQMQTQKTTTKRNDNDPSFQ